jgi:hypothetical protein
MASMPIILPSARVFTGPGDRLFGYERIWVLVYAGAALKTSTLPHKHHSHHLIRGRHGDDGSDLELLTHILQQARKGTVGALELAS